MDTNGVNHQQPALTQQLHLVTFRLDRQLYALPIEPIRQIIEMVTITPVPQVRSSVEGVINFRGSAVPVVNLRQHLGMSKAPLKLHTPIILVNTCNRLVGLIVDEVLDVLDRLSSEIINPRDVLPEELGDTPLLRGLFRSAEKMIMLLDIEHLFSLQQANTLAHSFAASEHDWAGVGMVLATSGSAVSSGSAAAVSGERHEEKPGGEGKPRSKKRARERQGRPVESPEMVDAGNKAAAGIRAADGAEISSAQEGEA